LKILDFDERNVWYRVIEGAEDDGHNDFAFGLSLAQLGHKLWPSLVILEFDDENVKCEVIEGVKNDGDNGFVFGLCFGHEICKFCCYAMA